MERQLERHTPSHTDSIVYKYSNTRLRVTNTHLRIFTSIFLQKATKLKPKLSEIFCWTNTNVLLHKIIISLISAILAVPS